MVTYRNRNNEIVSLDSELDEGGEGKVYTVSGKPGQVAKVWSSPNAEAAAKIEIMIGNRPPVTNGGGRLFVEPHVPFAWPEDTLIGSDGKVAGFLMPEIDTGSFVEIFHYYYPKARQKLELARGVKYRGEHFLKTARNLAEAVGCVHQAGYVIGDINEKNVLADGQGRIVIIDCDSMQVYNPQKNKTYLCNVGRPDYTPPGREPGDKRTANDDCFGLAVLIFQLLMRGVHPYQIADSQDQTTNSQAQTTADKIGRGVFPYKDAGSGQHNSEISRQFKNNWSNMKPGLRRCFREAFAPDYNSPRPSPAEWVGELDRIINPTRKDDRVEKVAKVTLVVASYALAPVITALLFALFY